MRSSKSGGRSSVTGWVDEELKAKVRELLKQYPRIKSESNVVIAALEYYINQVTKYGIDADWVPKRERK